jgi:hypothetical protein
MNNFQADYVICCNAEGARFDIVTDGLDDIGLKENEDYFVFEESDNLLE